MQDAPKRSKSLSVGRKSSASASLSWSLSAENLEEDVQKLQSLSSEALSGPEARNSQVSNQHSLSYSASASSEVAAARSAPLAAVRSNSMSMDPMAADGRPDRDFNMGRPFSMDSIPSIGSAGVPGLPFRASSVLRDALEPPPLPTNSSMELVRQLDSQEAPHWPDSSESGTPMDEWLQ